MYNTIIKKNRRHFLYQAKLGKKLDKKLDKKLVPYIHCRGLKVHYWDLKLFSGASYPGVNSGTDTPGSATGMQWSTNMTHALPWNFRTMFRVQLSEATWKHWYWITKLWLPSIVSQNFRFECKQLLKRLLCAKLKPMSHKSGFPVRQRLGNCIHLLLPEASPS